MAVDFDSVSRCQSICFCFYMTRLETPLRRCDMLSYWNVVLPVFLCSLLYPVDILSCQFPLNLENSVIYFLNDWRVSSL